jgi:hypothetical protein
MKTGSRWLGIAATAALALQPGFTQAADPTLDYQFFKTRVEPIFLKHRGDHVRCYVCHSESNTAFKLEKLPAGKKFWSEEQSRKQFDVISKLVVPGDPSKSLLLLRPLAAEQGGFPYHSGGRQFASKDDPEWKVIAQWVNGAKAKAN